MNQAMWRSAQTQRNAETLSAQGIKLWGPGIGDQACGDTGPGRMLEPLDIAARTAASFETGSLAGLRLTITAGPTREPLDPVRYISNHSSGKMGFSLAQAAVSAGAHVTLISGPVNLATPDHVTRIDINSAQDMLQAAESDAAQCDIFIACAAVADYRPSAVAEHKIKKGKEEIMELHLIKNPDIVATIASKVNAPFTVGFAAETRDIVSYAQDKLVRKKLDLIIANDVSRTDIGFNSDDNAVTLVTADQVTELPMMRKRQLATSLIDHIAQLYKANR